MDRIVIAGSSAGAMISLSAEWEICKGNGPKGFRAAGVMSFAGAIMSDSGTPSYPSEPCPQLLIHGTADNFVPVAMSRAIYARNPSMITFVEVNGAPHGLSYFQDHELYCRAFCDFLARTA